jgi:hypothetical protein
MGKATIWVRLQINEEKSCFLPEFFVGGSIYSFSSLLSIVSLSVFKII